MLNFKLFIFGLLKLFILTVRKHTVYFIVIDYCVTKESLFINTVYDSGLFLFCTNKNFFNNKKDMKVQQGNILTTKI